MRKTPFILFFVFVLLVGIVSAVSPFTTTSTIGLDISYPQFETVKKDQRFQLNIHVYNKTTGYLMTNDTTSCNLHLYNHSGDEFLEQDLFFDTNEKNFYLEIGSGNFSTVEQYVFYIDCNTSEAGGTVSGLYSVTEDGFSNSNLDSSAGIAIIIFMLAVIAGLFYLPFMTKFSENEMLNHVLKYCSWVLALFLLILASVTVGTIADTANLGIFSEVFRFTWVISWGCYLLLAYTVLRFLFKGIELMKENSERNRGLK